MKTSNEYVDKTLTDFNPEKVEVDARSWIKTADMCMQDQPLQGAALMIVLSWALNRPASAWLSQVSFLGMSWNQFKEIYISRYN